MEWTTDESINRDVRSTFNRALYHAYYTCGIELQQENIRALDSLYSRLIILRDEAISRTNEPRANAALRAMLITSGAKNFLEMWVRLKEDDPTEAWLKLVAAQEAFTVAQRICFDPLTDNLAQHLLSVQDILFPPQIFASSGYTYSKALCTICNVTYGECEHICGRLYMGKICQREIIEANLTEVSVVEHPNDKRCRITRIGTNGKVHCTLTRREVPQETPIDPEHDYISGVIPY